MNRNLPVLIAGAGVSGLVCALTLQKSKIPFFILESTDRVGGRIKTDRTEEGFLLDRGFQVLLNSYPRLSEFLDLTNLNLKLFSSGALIYGRGQNSLLANPFQHPSFTFRTLFSSVPTFKDKLLVSKLVLKSQFFKDMQSLSGQSTYEFLTEYGFSEKFIKIFWIPFLGGVYLDRELRTDANFFLFIMRCFSLGNVSLPELGMESIPKQMAKRLSPGSLRLSAPVKGITQNHVTLENGESLAGIASVQAFDRVQSGYRSVLTYYFSASILPDWKKWLLLIPPGSGFQVNHIALLSAVSPEYAPNGRILISANVVPDGKNPIATLTASKILDEINEIAGKNLNLVHLRTDSIEHALPRLSSDRQLIENDSYFECGDHLSSPSLYGAIKSGNLTAHAIMKKHYGME